MINIIIRFFIVYSVTVVSMRAMGKRQIAEMEMSELVTAFFLSELATYCITDRETPILYGLVPMFLLISTEVLISFLIVKSKKFKRLFYSAPSLLIDNGKIIEKELVKNRITTDELFSSLRQKDQPDIRKVKYAILEPNGQISVVPFGKAEPPDRNDMNINCDDPGYSVVVIDDGAIDESGLKKLGKDVNWLKKELAKMKVKDEKNILVLAFDDSGNKYSQFKMKK